MPNTKRSLPSTSFPIGARSKHTVTPATPADEGFAAAREDARREELRGNRDRTFERIAQDVLGITLTERGFDSLDFHDVSVGSLRKLMEGAYRAGLADAGKGAL